MGKIKQNDRHLEKNKKNKQRFFSIDKIVQISFMLSLLIVAKMIMKLIPDLPNGLGDISNLIQIFIIIFSLVFGFSKTIIAVALFILVIAWSSPSMFIGGVLYVKGGLSIFGVYFLDYVLPLMILSLAGLGSKIFKHDIKIKNFKISKHIFIVMFIIILIFINYISHVGSGIIFFSSYAWSGWGPITFSFAANAIKLGALIFMIIVIYPIIVFNIKPKFTNKINQWS